ncbi:BamA/TamA family outer membrane protein [Parahaliea maris]|uniref:BamA/TamA family outer membrane protein n=1 Tax=Parahaliea maris TaxID=2716870 RepID=A0A5C8ZMZ7_9GAMM|nr:patatin-like phospholipase family protein [Parahaliea maris]TXS89876.1 BamA/TamA family outer membrane protein [Parahaliea maris]
MTLITAPRSLFTLPLLLLGCLVALPVTAGTETGREHPGVALVLSGGGARGLAHIGVLQALEEMRVPVDCVVGTSMGALVGGVYAAGIDPAGMQQELEAMEIAELFDDNPPRPERDHSQRRDDYRPLFGFSLGVNESGVQLPAGASSGYKFELFLKELLGTGLALAQQDFDNLPTPFRAVATDLESGAMKVFDRGDITRVMRASMSLPAVLAPMEIDGRIYADGGLVRNLPVDVARATCGDVVVAVNLGTPPNSRESLTSSLAVASQAIVLLTEQNVQRSLAELTASDVLIVPELADYTSSDFSDLAPIIQSGREAVQAQRDGLASLSLGTEEYARWLAGRAARKPPQRQVNALVAASGRNVAETAIMQDIHASVGDDFDLHHLGTDIGNAYGRGDYSYIGYSILPEGEAARIEVEATSKPWGPGFLKFGLGAATDFNSPSQLNLAASYRRNWINRLGASWRVDGQLGYDSYLSTEFAQPLQLRDGAFMAAYLAARREIIQAYRGEDRIGDVTVVEASGGFDVGVSGRGGELRFGPFLSYADTTPDFGFFNPVTEERSYQQAGLRLTGVHDQLDSYAFPRHGALVRLDAEAGLPDWGSDTEQLAVRLELRGAHSIGSHTFAASIEAGGDLNGDGNLLVQDRYQLGGARRLSGLFLQQLTGDRYQLATLGYYHQYARLPTQLGEGLYLGMSMEAGRIDDPLSEDPFDWIGGTGVFWGADTILGAMLFGYGYSTTGQSAWYLTLGQSF